MIYVDSSFENTCDEIFDDDSHSANDFIEQSHDKGLSNNDKLVNVFVVSNAFFETIEISFPSMHNSFNDGSGAIKSDDNVLKRYSEKIIKLLCVNSKNLMILT